MKSEVANRVARSSVLWWTACGALSLRKDMLNQLHSSHISTGGCVRRARKILYWPQMSAEIRDFVSHCTICQTYRLEQAREELQPHELPLSLGRKLVWSVCSWTADIHVHGGLLVQFLWSSRDPQEDSTICYYLTLGAIRSSWYPRSADYGKWLRIRQPGVQEFLLSVAFWAPNV